MLWGTFGSQACAAVQTEEDGVANKTDFTADEWQALQWAVTDTMTYLTMADPGFWDMFKEANAAAHYIAGVKQTSESALVRQLASEIE